MIVAVTGGRNRTPTLRELERLVMFVRGVSDQFGQRVILRHGACPRSRDKDGRIVGSTDIECGEYIKARGLADVEAWPANWDLHQRAAGPIRNRAMLRGQRRGELISRGQADVLVRFDGGRGTEDCHEAADELGVPVYTVPTADEPRVWNRHHGTPPGPALYIGRNARDPSKSSPLANPNPLTLEDGETRGQAAGRNLAAYKRWLWERIQPGGPARAELESVTADHYLVCSCWPHACHGEIVVRAWRWLHGRE